MVPAIYASVALNYVFLCYCVPDNNIIRLKGQIGYSAVGLSVNLMLYQKYSTIMDGLINHTAGVSG